MKRRERFLDGRSDGELVLFAAIATAGVAAPALAFRNAGPPELVVFGLAAPLVGAHGLACRQRRA